jgi:hypothetical protein
MLIALFLQLPLPDSRSLDAMDVVNRSEVGGWLRSKTK